MGVAVVPVKLYDQGGFKHELMMAAGKSDSQLPFFSFQLFS
jgi:hypothetical protein